MSIGIATITVLILTLTLFQNNMVAASEQQLQFRFDEVPPLPNPDGFAGMFAGVSNGALIAAGGTNFPTKRIWEGGKKSWYDQIFVLDPASRQWQIAAQRLPRPLAYGVSVTWHNFVICVGGADPKKASAEVFAMQWLDGRIVISKFPSLPKPCVNACGAVVDDVLYMAGGLSSLDASKANQSFYAMDLRAEPVNRRWIELPSWPGRARENAVAASAEGCFWLMAGDELQANPEGNTSRVTPLLRDLYCFKPRRISESLTGIWNRRADVPRAALASPSPAPLLNDHQLIILGGGDDQENTITDAKHHPGYNTHVLEYDTRQDRWYAVGTIPTKTAPVDAPSTTFQNGWLVVGGEIAPSLRTNRSLFIRG